MPRPQTTPEAYALLHNGMQALATMSASGMRVDRGYLDTAIAQGEAQVSEMVARIADDPIAKVWKRRYREKTNFLAPAQMAQVVFGDLGFASRGRTAKGGRESADEHAFAHVQAELPVVKTLFAAKKIKNAVDTFLTGIRRESVRHADGNWYVHPFYNLNTTITHRSSSDSPNVKNQPARNPVMAEMVRRCYIPRPGWQLIEIDLGQIEARMPCCYTFDPVLIDYVSNPKSDMHRDMGAQLFRLKPEQVSKQARQLAKGAYVFATFYGSYWGLTAPALWEALDNPAQPITLKDSPVTVREHLASLGVTELGEVDSGDPAAGTWAASIRDIDRHFWGERFKVYAQWKRDWYEAYLRDGGFQMLTGFAVCLPLDKKQVTNSPIQGSSFHIVLRAVPLINEWLEKHQFRARVICEIYDCCILDCPPEERDDVIDMVVYFLTESVMKAWPWINIPIVAEPEICPIDRPWYEKSSLVKREDFWIPADTAKWKDKYGPWELQMGGSA